ncbi:NADH-quinone oxidoreductase subunit J family protein [Adhaeretor mobilis]|uniref:NADH-quinone oxidoreductase subunit J n=1 Tax=Adhaeretor mobilis TaxID=1930276 RepID=A0A517MV16_9BACT|nr:NADH-quinone oxidoreductase subunit J [Adhaeretor mobilis]QDS98716.1 NADH-quinone oxidoreductase subunit J [Adhaeretor mobilis]
MDAIYWPSFFFLLFGLLACGFAVAVLLATNIVRMAFYLIMSLSATSGLFFLAGADFVGAMQLMIYVGGTLVLLIFGVMLTSQERFVEMKTMAGDWIFGFLAGGALLVTLCWVAFSVPAWRGIDRAAAEQLQVEPTVAPLAMGLLGARTDEGGEHGYLLFFEIVSVHLLVVLVGAAYLARAKISRGTAAERTSHVEPGAALPK